MELKLYSYDQWPRFAKAFRAAKPDDLPELTPVAAYPGCGRVVALGEMPPFVCEYAVVQYGTSLEVVADVLRWYCGGNDSRAVDYAGWLSRVFNAEVREVQVVDFSTFDSIVEDYWKEFDKR